MDKARVNVGRISQFGIMEMSRQRIAKTLNDAIHLECPHCEGRGKVKSVEAMAVSFLRKVHAAAAKGTVAEVRGGLPLEVAYYLLNRKKRELTQIENDYEIEVTVKGKTSFLLNQLELETIKREKPHLEDVLKSEAEAEEAHKPRVPTSVPQAAAIDEEEKADGAGTAEGGKKRKRRKKKKKVAGDGHQDAAAPVQTEADSDHGDDSRNENAPETSEASTSEAGDGAADQAAKPKKRKRRRSRGKAHKGVEYSQEATADGAVPEPAAPEVAAADLPPTDAAVKTKPARVRGPRKKKAAEVVEEPTSSAPVAGAADVPDPSPAPKKPRRSAAKSTAKKETVAAEPVPVVVPEKPKPAKRPAAPKQAKKSPVTQ